MGFSRCSRIFPVRRCWTMRRFHLGPGEAGHLPEDCLTSPFSGLLRLVMLEADQRPAREGLGEAAVGELEIGWFFAVEEGPDLVERSNPFGAKCHDHPPMISSPRTSGSSPAGNQPPVRAHVPLDKTSTSPFADAALP